MKKLLFTLYLGFMAFAVCLGQSNYSINIDVPEKEIVAGHLDLGGTNPNGDSIGVNSYYITYNGKPFFPVIGEIHYSRYPAQYWEESIRKMKAGGINVIATYVFWNIHEREEGVFDWSGNLNLRRFAELCEKNGTYLIVRMGPFCHGEMRNGGIPDWLYKKYDELIKTAAPTLKSTLKYFIFTCGGSTDAASSNTPPTRDLFTKYGVESDYSEMEGGHTMYVWRHDLSNFAQKIFK